MSGALDYSALQTLVDNLIKNAGEPIILRKGTDTIGSEPWRPGPRTTVDYVGHSGVFFPNGIRGPFRLALRKYSEVSESDVVCYIPGKILPEPLRVNETDVLIRKDGSQWRMRFVDFLDPAGTVLYYELRVHK